MPSGTAPPSEAESPLTLYKDDVLGVLSVGLTSATTRNMALAGLKAMVSTRNLLLDEELAFIVHNVDQIIEGNTDEFDDARLVFCCIEYDLTEIIHLVMMFWRFCQLSANMPLAMLQNKRFPYFSAHYLIKRHHVGPHPREPKYGKHCLHFRLFAFSKNFSRALLSG